MILVYLQGCWRKVTVDDFLPFTEQTGCAVSGDDAGGTTRRGADGGGDIGSTAAEVDYVPLFPRTAHKTELWPAILTKAILKIAALE